MVSNFKGISLGFTKTYCILCEAYCILCEAYCILCEAYYILCEVVGGSTETWSETVSAQNGDRFKFVTPPSGRYFNIHVHIQNSQLFVTNVGGILKLLILFVSLLNFSNRLSC